MRISTPRLLSASLYGLLFGFVLLTHSAAAQTSVGSVNVGSSATTTVTVTIPDGGTLSTISVVTQGEPNLDFTDAGGGSCATGAVYATNASCTVNVAFKPRHAGARYGAVVLASSTGILATNYLQGKGLGPQATFLPATQSFLKLGNNGSNQASAVNADGNGNLYVATRLLKLLKETPSSSGYIESVVGDVQSQYETGTVDGAGNIYYVSSIYSSPSNYIGFNVTKVSRNGNAYTSSIIYSSNLFALTGVVIDGGGDVFFIDSTGSLIKETPSGNTYSQSTIFTGLSVVGTSDIAVDGNGNLFIWLSSSLQPGKSIMELSPSSTGYSDSYVFPDISPGTSNFISISVDQMDNVYIETSGQIYKETLLNGSYVESPVFGYNMYSIDGAGNYYYGDGNGNVIEIDNADPPSLSFETTLQGATSTDSPQIVTVSNFGNEPLNISAVSFPPDFPEDARAEDDCVPGASLSAIDSCKLTIDFSPIAALGSTPNNLSESVSVTTNTLNTSAAQQNIAVFGLESLNQPAPTPVISPLSGNYYTSRSVNVNITDALQGATIIYVITWTSSTGAVTSLSGSVSNQSPITVSFYDDTKSVTVEATATAPGYLSSHLSTVTYTYTYEDFSVQVSPSSIPGASGTATVTITPLNSNGFQFPITFSCSAPPAQGDSCSFSPATVTPGNSTVSTTMTVRPASTSSELHRHSSPLFPGSVLAVTLCCIGWKGRRRLRVLLLITVSITGLSLINGCGAACTLCGQPTDTTPVTYTLGVYATSGSVSHTAYFNYVVNVPNQ
jgi:hypothetical protein